jgi:hypothetical protein
MKFVIREADLQRDKQVIIGTALRFLTPLSDDSRFGWLYENNIHGQARVWFVYSGDDGAVMGMAGAFPRRIYIDGRKELAWVLGDFCISDQYRSLGPALALQRACLAEVDRGVVAFCYDFPSASMMAVYKRLQISPFGYVLRLAKPLRVDRQIRAIIKNPVIKGALSSAGNLLLRVNERKTGCDSSVNVSIQQGRCGEEFSELGRTIADRRGVFIQRSAEYLNWRYLQDPLHRYELLAARRDGALLGYGVFLHEGEDALLVDLFGVEDEGVISALIIHGVALMKARDVQTVSATIVEAHPWRALLERQGFRIREASPIVIYFPSGMLPRGDLTKLQNWLFMGGDRDS